VERENGSARSYAEMENGSALGWAGGRASEKSAEKQRGFSGGCGDQRLQCAPSKAAGAALLGAYIFWGVRWT
jgi:hypothetical protein